jgi:hypothetical protein
MRLLNGHNAKYEIDELLEAGERNGFSAKAEPIVDGRSYSIIYKKKEGSNG